MVERKLAVKVGRRRRALALVFGGVLTIAVVSWLSGGSSDKPSTCFGNSSHGALRDAWKLPRTGPNFRAYSDVGWLLGRTFVHSAVHTIVLESYGRLAVTKPQHQFIYGETGFARGGSFRPHRTHQNGLAVDFMVPVRDASGTIRELPTSALEKFGYELEFDASGALADLRIDFEAMALHLSELRRSAAAHGVRIARVIFDPELRVHLARTHAWSDIQELPFMPKPAWVRHDEHYHVDFEVPCEPLGTR